MPPKPKNSDAHSKGRQQTLAAFKGFKNVGAKKIVEKASSDNEALGADDHIEESDESDGDDALVVTKAVRGAAPDASHLPPINSVPAMFTDLVSHIPQIKGVAEHVQGRKLRVATMCSGTESPLLAMTLMGRSIAEQHGINLEFEHVFSCEIEPFKQAYIERNFHPPLLFRDVCELGDTEAHTAYGALAPVPGDVDILIAGTSCVDYSNLNNEKQDIDANGESGRTFRGMMSWVKTRRPPIVILENVCSAPWDRVKAYFEKSGYSATHTRVDTKHYYIPHTRTRVYLVAVNQRHSSMPDQWKATVTQKLRRDASSTLDAFLLPSDDPRIYQARQKMVQEGFNALDRRTGRTDWGRCESRHQRARVEEKLGPKRPLTSWDDGGFCKLPDFAWGDWGVGQVERVWDLMDISLLRSASKGIDPSYKTQVWNLSQNVDRSTGSSKVGICPCLTPSMIPYITNRGGPMVGLEALSMQGLPVDELLLTRESEDQLADLAGNAMSTTVVGACILAALVVGKKLLKAGDDTESYEMKEHGSNEYTLTRTDNTMVVDEPSVESHIMGEEYLIEKPLDLSTLDVRPLSELLVDAEKSSRLCECEGRTDITTRQLFRCTDCSTSSCKKCGGRPEHNPTPIDLMANPRSLPSAFVKELKSSLPMCMSLSNITQELLDSIKDATEVKIPDSRWERWTAAVLRASEQELHFVEPKRQEVWTVVYQSPAATLELLLHPLQPEWRLYAKPEEKEPANAEIRRLLEHPVARLTCLDGLLTGRWDIALPYSESISIKIEGLGELVPAWEARLGLQDQEFSDKKVYGQLQVTVPPEQIAKFDRNVSGIYYLLDKCGTANGALHKRTATEDESNLPPLFMLLDPHRTNDSEDSFVFSISKRRYEYGESRPIICKLDPTWRQSSQVGVQKVACHLPCTWAPASIVQLQSSRREDARFCIPGPILDISASNEACASAMAILTCKVPLGTQTGPEWPRGVWEEVDKVHERSTFKSIAWLLEPIRNAVNDNFSSWQVVSHTPEENHADCERCAPSAPELTWMQVKQKVVPVEDSIQAGEYERRLKARPSPFVTQLKLDDNNTGNVRVGLNVTSLIHRALSRLPSKNRTEAASVSWRLDTNFTPMMTLQLPKFVLSSNKKDKEHAQPPNFKLPLRVEQLRSLEWMLQQESTDMSPFIEEEISEAMLHPLGWRAEGRAQRPVHIRGGVLADQVGYGKTAITLGLIDCASKDVKHDFAKLGRIEGKISVKATLIIVPPHLTRQWASEVKKFSSKKFNVVQISTAANLNSLTIEEVQEADIVVVASNLFRSNVYLDNLQALAADRDLPIKDGRHFNASLQNTLASLRKQTDVLQDEGSVAVLKNMREAKERADKEAAAAAALAQSKRLKGKSYRDAAEAKLSTVKPEVAEGKGSPETRPSYRSPSGLIMEVVIPLRPKQKASPLATNTDHTTGGDDTDSDTPRTRTRRAVTKKAIIISDDEDDVVSEYEDEDEDEKLPKKSLKTSVSKRNNASKSGSSDYDDDSAEETEEETETAVESAQTSDEEPKPKATSKSKAKPKATSKKVKGKKSQTSSEASADDDDETMDVNEPPTKKKSMKRKATDDDARPVKKQKRQDTDPWKLGSKTVKNDWTQMQAPPMEMFHFARKVVDEYTYLDGKVHSLVTNLTAERHWVLSGTPPIHDFAALKTIAAFLNVHLGVDDDAEGQSVEVKKRRREQTAVERFHSFREVHSLEWHAHRHQLGQVFLDRFVRQNIAEIDEIPFTNHLEKVILPAAERAIYLELEHHLRALDMTMKKTRKTESDREKRLAKALGDSKTPEEALLKRCSHFDLDTYNNENAMKACDVIVEERQKQLDECKAELLQCIKDGVKREKSLGNVDGESIFSEFIKNSRKEGHGDKDASEMINGLLDDAKAVASSAKPKAKGKDEPKLSEKVKEAVWDHREKTHHIRRLAKELVGRVRSLRFFTVVRDLQKQREVPPVVSCPICGRDNVPIDEVAVLSSCGHTGCLTCVTESAMKEECVYAPSKACLSAARVLNIVKGETLGVDDEARDGRGKHFGAKLERVINLIKNEIPKDERVLIFVQFTDLMKKLTEALSSRKIKFLEIRGTAHQKSKNLEKFQNEGDERVLLLNVMDESASGANLTCANHAIFLSPLLAPTKEIYKANETQAVGRLVRYGQQKNVQIWRFLTLSTIDEEIYEKQNSQDPHMG